MDNTYFDLIEKAKEVLRKNWTGEFTIPASKLYPHQWSWDAALIAVGYAHFNQERAEQELRHLFTGQWSNGMLPHMIFNPEVTDYFPGPEFWQTKRSPDSPKDVDTSGGVQPPVHATACLLVYEKARDKVKAKEFLKEMYPKLCAWHDYLHRERDPEGEGLVYIRHPWESGMDNSPVWDVIFKGIEIPEGEVPDYNRTDTQTVNPDDRPDNETYDRYVYLVKLFYDNDYDEKAIREETPFLVQDVLFNALLARADKDLAQIADHIGEDGSEYKSKAEQISEAMNAKLWDEEHSIYFDYDMKNDKIIDSHLASGFLPLFARIPDQKQAESMREYLDSAHFAREHGKEHGIPSYDEEQPGFSPNRYWRGPVWININWFLYHGLKHYHFDEYADWIKKAIIGLPQKHGFYEYYNPHKGTGHGADEFSWSASLLLDLIHREGLL